MTHGHNLGGLSAGRFFMFVFFVGDVMLKNKRFDQQILHSASFGFVLLFRISIGSWLPTFPIWQGTMPSAFIFYCLRSLALLFQLW
jgi:hypothetical protein